MYKELDDPADASNEESALPETLQNSQPATATYITDVSTNNLEASIDLHMPDDIRRLSDAYENGFPIAIIANVDSPLFPFKLRVSSCRYAVLGYFHILNIKVRFYTKLLSLTLTILFAEDNRWSRRSD